MGDRTSKDRLVALLHRHASILEALATGTTGRDALAASLECSRSTVARGIRELETAGLVELSTGSPSLTRYGRLVFQEYTDLTRGLAKILYADDLLGSLPGDVPMDSSVVREGMVVRGAEASGLLADILTGTDRLHVLLGEGATDLGPFMTRIDGGASLRAVIPASVTRRLAASGRSVEFGPGVVTLRETDDPLPFTITVVETTDGESMAVCGHTDGTVQWVLAAEPPAPVAWAGALVESRWHEATPLPSP